MKILRYNVCSRDGRRCTNKLIDGCGLPSSPGFSSFSESWRLSGERLRFNPREAAGVGFSSSVQAGIGKSVTDM